MQKKKLLGILLAASMTLQTHAISTISAIQAVKSFTATAICKPVLAFKNTRLKNKVLIGAGCAVSLYAIYLLLNLFKNKNESPRETKLKELDTKLEKIKRKMIKTREANEKNKILILKCEAFLLQKNLDETKKKNLSNKIRRIKKKQEYLKKKI